MLANTPKHLPRRKSAAIEVMLSSLDTPNDLLSGSECSSPAGSPIHEESFTFRTPSLKQQHRRNEKSRLGLRISEPVEAVQEFLKHMSEPHLAKVLIAEDAKAECHSVMVRGEDEKNEATQAVQGDLDELLAGCSRCDIDLDGIFACGEHVAAFGHFAYSDGSSSLHQDLHFSIRACVDVAREQIVKFRWLDQVVRVEDDSTDRH